MFIESFLFNIINNSPHEWNHHHKCNDLYILLHSDTKKYVSKVIQITITKKGNKNKNDIDL